MGVKPHKGVVRGWQFFSAPDIESSIGPWKVYFRRKVSTDDDGNLVYGDWCDGNVIRLTLPGRMIVTPEEALDESGINQRVADALFHAHQELMRVYGWTLTLPRQKNAQQYEAGTLRYDPLLADWVMKQGKGIIELPDAPGITVDGSHKLLKEGIVHLDCEKPQQAAMQAAPVVTIEAMRRSIEQQTEAFTDVVNQSIETIEERAVNATSNITDGFRTELGTLMAQMNNSYEELLAREEERRIAEEVRRNEQWEEAFEADRTAFRDRMNRIADRFQNALRQRAIDPEEGQTMLTDFF